MLKHAAEIVGQKIEHMGDEFMEEHYAWRVEHPNAFETPNNSLYSAVGTRLQSMGGKLVTFAGSKQEQ